MDDRSHPLEDLLNRIRRRLRLPDRGGSLSVGSPATSLDLLDSGDRFVVAVDAPGYERDDLEIRLSGTELAIDGERERGLAVDDTYLRQERHANAFSRRLALPGVVDEDGVEARLRNGVVTISLPKRAGRGRRIDLE